MVWEQRSDRCSITRRCNLSISVGNGRLGIRIVLRRTASACYRGNYVSLLFSERSRIILRPGGRSI